MQLSIGQTHGTSYKIEAATMTENKRSNPRVEAYKIIFVNLYSTETMARYLLSSYVLKAYLCKFFDNNEVVIDIFNFDDKTETSEIWEQIIKNNPDCVGYSCYIWNIEKIFKVISGLRKESKSIIHILGGPEISFNRISSLPDPSIADYYIIGEGEKRLYGLISYLKAKKRGLNVKFPDGIAFYKNNKLNYYP